MARPRRDYDAAERAAAVRLDQQEPAWIVWYGVASRLFYAVPAWETPKALILDAPSIEELVARMRATEHEHRARP